MLNLMKADFYRILRSKGLYISFGLYWLFTAGVSALLRNNASYIDESNVPHIIDLGYLKGIDALLITDISTLIYVFAAALFVLGAADFSSGAIKNTLLSGLTRTKYFFSKLFTSWILIVIFFIGNLAVSVLSATIFHGFGSIEDSATVVQLYGQAIPTADFIRDLLCNMGGLLFGAITAATIGIGLLFITRSGAAMLATYLGIMFGLNLIVTIVMFIGKDFDFIAGIARIDFINQSAILGTFGQSTAENIAKAFAAVAVWLAASLSAGLLVFRKSEIK
ncbi:MAG: hypothetical protein LBS74_04940 [Oscillospiraceae bacterium]|jgi:ABC-2 type transport system permease protein|nr:hypothetical protein [Oscillospiraceae bacterium]